MTSQPSLPHEIKNFKIITKKTKKSLSEDMEISAPLAPDTGTL